MLCLGFLWYFFFLRSTLIIEQNMRSTFFLGSILSIFVIRIPWCHVNITRVECSFFFSLFFSYHVLIIVKIQKFLRLIFVLQLHSPCTFCFMLRSKKKKHTCGWDWTTTEKKITTKCKFSVILWGENELDGFPWFQYRWSWVLLINSVFHAFYFKCKLLIWFVVVVFFIRAYATIFMPIRSKWFLCRKKKKQTFQTEIS